MMTCVVTVWTTWHILTKLHEPMMDSTLFFNPFQVVYMNFTTKNLLACLCSASSTVETISMIFPYLVNFYLHIQNPINIISMSTTYLESFGADLSENKPFQCVSILLIGTSTMKVIEKNWWEFPSKGAQSEKMISAALF